MLRLGTEFWQSRDDPFCSYHGFIKVNVMMSMTKTIELVCDLSPLNSHYPSRPGTRPVRPWLLPKSLMSIGTLGLQ